MSHQSHSTYQDQGTIHQNEAQENAASGPSEGSRLPTTLLSNMLLSPHGETKLKAFHHFTPKMHRLGGTVTLVVTMVGDLRRRQATDTEERAFKGILDAAFGHYTCTDEPFDWGTTCTEKLGEAGLQSTHSFLSCEPRKLLSALKKIGNKVGEKNTPNGSVLFNQEKRWAKPAKSKKTRSRAASRRGKQKMSGGELPVEEYKMMLDVDSEVEQDDFAGSAAGHHPDDGDDMDWQGGYEASRVKYSTGDHLTQPLIIHYTAPSEDKHLHSDKLSMHLTWSPEVDTRLAAEAETIYEGVLEAAQTHYQSGFNCPFGFYQECLYGMRKTPALSRFHLNPDQLMQISQDEMEGMPGAVAARPRAWQLEREILPGHQSTTGATYIS